MRTILLVGTPKTIMDWIRLNVDPKKAHNTDLSSLRVSTDEYRFIGITGYLQIYGYEAHCTTYLELHNAPREVMMKIGHHYSPEKEWKA